MGEPFIDKCEQEFSLLHYIKKYVDERKSEREPIICTSIGMITKMEDINIVQIFDYKHFMIDNMGVYDIVGIENRLV